MRVIADAEDECAVDRLDVIARQAALIAFIGIEIHGANELFEWRRLQNDLSVRVGDDACAVEDDAVVAADEIDEHDRNLRHHRAVRHHRAALAHLAFIER